MNKPVQYHVMPVKDIREHIEGMNCFCKPTCIEYQIENIMLILHNSFDGSDKETINTNHLELKREQFN